MTEPITPTQAQQRYRRRAKSGLVAIRAGKVTIANVPAEKVEAVAEFCAQLSDD